jgi:hypothetical protein
MVRSPGEIRSGYRQPLTGLPYRLPGHERAPTLGESWHGKGAPALCLRRREAPTINLYEEGDLRGFSRGLIGKRCDLSTAQPRAGAYRTASHR